MRFLTRLLIALLPIVLMTGPAPAMQQSDSPTKFNIPWASSASTPYVRPIPEASQIGIQNCAASLTDGFPPLTFVPAGSGGCPPFGADFNGIMKQITQWSRWGQASGPVFYSSVFSASIGGYPKGAMLQSATLVGRVWFSTAENNTTDPDSTSAAGWIVQPGTATPGQVLTTLNTIAPPNTVSANGTTVGNASSNASGRANADTYWLFVRLWTDCSGCQLFNSAGGAIARGATANADFAANNAMATNNLNGSALMTADSQSGTTSTNLVNVPVTSGSRTAPGSILGENLHVLVTAELAVHSHAVFISDPGHAHAIPNFPTQIGAGTSGGGLAYSSTTTGATATAFTGMTIGDTVGAGNNLTAVNGSGTAHNTVPRSAIVYSWLSL